MTSDFGLSLHAFLHFFVKNMLIMGLMPALIRLFWAIGIQNAVFAFRQSAWDDRLE